MNKFGKKLPKWPAQFISLDTDNKKYKVYLRIKTSKYKADHCHGKNK